MARVLGVGIATLDVINTVDGYPSEDEKTRALAQRISRGGNCTNTLVVLSQLGHSCAWAGVLADEPDARRIQADLAHYDIDTKTVRTVAQGKVPTSYIALNRRNGSRTVIHYRDLPEFTYEDFLAIDLHDYDWLHFEGRNVHDTALMLRRAQDAKNHDSTVSLEIETLRPDIERLLPFVDILLYSRSYLYACGHDEPRHFLENMRHRAPHAVLILAYGAAGAYGLSRDNVLSHSPAFPPPIVVDTLGAGDTFNAGIIDATLKGMPLLEILEYACRLAGHKCGQVGLDLLAHD